MIEKETFQQDNFNENCNVVIYILIAVIIKIAMLSYYSKVHFSSLIILQDKYYFFSKYKVKLRE